MENSPKQLFSNRRLFALILPLLFEQYLAIMVGMADSIMASSVGEAAISGVSLVNNISAVMLNLFTALAAGGGIVTSQFLGANRKDEAQRSTGQLITMSLFVSLLVMTLCLIFSRFLLRLFFGAIEQDVMDAAATYFFYNALSFPFLALYSAFAAILRADGNTRVSFYVSLIRNAVNIAGNALCIYGLGMGVEGVAIPTAFSRLVGAAFMAFAVSKSQYPLRPRKKDIFHINPRLMGRMLRVGFPTAVENSIFQLGRVVTLSMIAGFGTYQITANSTANTLVNMTVSTNTALSVASMTVIGQCIGAQDPVQIRKNSKKLLLLGYGFQVVINSFLILFRYPLLGIFQNLSPETVELSAKLMCIHLGNSMLLYPLSFLLPGFLRAASDSAFPMYTSIASMAIFRLTLARILCVELGWGAPGVWWAMIADWVCRSILFSIRWFGGGWKKKFKLSDEKKTA